MRAELRAALIANPDDVETLRVLADELQAAGDPRGELMALQLARESETMPAKARWFDDTIARHFRAHGEQILGPLRWWADDAGFSPHWRWRRGMIDSVDTSGVADGRALLEAVLTHPAGQLVRRMRVEGEPLDPLVEVLREHGPASLRALRLDSRVSMAANVWRSFPWLTELTSTCPLAHDDMPGIRTATLFARGMSALDRHWPDLESLTLWPGEHETIRTLDGLPRLTKLTVHGYRFMAELVEMLVTRPPLAMLDLPRSSLSDDVALRWAANAKGRVGTLRVRGHRMSHVGVAALRDVADRVIARQKDDR